MAQVLDLERHLLGLHLRVGEYLGGVHDVAPRHARPVQPLDPSLASIASS